MTATCGFRDAYGFAFVTDGFVGNVHPGARLSRGVHGGGALQLRRAIVRQLRA